MKFNKKCQAMQLRRKNPRHQDKLKHRRFSLNLRKHFDVWVTEPWYRLPRDVVEVPISRRCMYAVVPSLPSPLALSRDKKRGFLYAAAHREV